MLILPISRIKNLLNSFFASDPSIHVARQLATEVERHIRGGKTYYQAILTMVNDGWATRLIEATPLEYRELGLPH